MCFVVTATVICLDYSDYYCAVSTSNLVSSRRLRDYNKPCYQLYHLSSKVFTYVDGSSDMEDLSAARQGKCELIILHFCA